ncbi:glycosyltransferase [Haloplanus rubicundus]|uniref:Glycosyltransferase family 4 protein n=1 Tax=Haloplanus rubicundus TaxID=1547898 RepID=A0A345EBX9_9EURY|nr:glycosyltransferase [Haloplanus rubicundus]AXG09701.1 glycosyltransferase family 4 protein [Haloplanus rubicundus]
MDILIVSHLFPTPNDSVRGIYVLQQARALSERGHNVEVISPIPRVPEIAAKILNRTSSKNVPESDSYDDITVHYPRYWSLPCLGTLPIVAYSFRRTLYQNRHLFESADLINAHVALPDGFGSLKLAHSLDVPLVTTVHGFDLQHSIHHRFCKSQIRSVFQSSTRIILNSGKLKRIYADNFDDLKKVEVVHNGFSVEKALNAQSVEAPRSSLRITSVGNLDPEKGHRYVLEALSDLSLDYEYVVIGDGPLQSDLEEKAKTLNIDNKVSFIGKVDHEEVFSYLKSADLFVLPSYEEAFGIAYLEAMACGLPVIACEGEGPADFITHRETGFLVPPQNSGAITDLIRELNENPELRRHIGDRAQRTALNGFSWERNAESIERIFREAIKDHN